MSNDRQGAGAPNFTPGPWEVSRQNGDPYESFNGIIGPAQTNRLGKEYRTYVAQYIEPKNAHLIASAPDLYEALEAMRAEFRAADLPYGSKAYLQAGEALAKARGEA